MLAVGLHSRVRLQLRVIFCPIVPLMRQRRQIMAGKIMLASTAVLILALLTTGVVFAKGGPSKVTISGPGLVDVVEVTDPKLLLAFEFYRFENISRRIEAPADPGEGYVVTRYV